MVVKVTVEKVIELIQAQKMWTAGSSVGVACSGGSDSMALLHFLFTNKEKLDIEVMAIHVNHGTRDNDLRDAIFVEDYCKENHIRFYKFKVESRVLAKQKGWTIEQACREARYGVFDSLRKRGIVDKIALAHQQRDQAETVLLNILRGSGLTGAGGMQYVRDDFYVRPFLEVPNQEIMAYVYENEIPYVEDETNIETFFSRNLLRQKIMPELRQVWPKADETISNFGKICREDDKTIRDLMNFNALLSNGKVVKIPLSYFYYQKSFVARLLLDCFSDLGVGQGVEKKHMDMLCEFAFKSENGAKLNMPGEIIAYKEYEYITLAKQKSKLKINTSWEFKRGVTKFEDYGTMKIKKTSLREPTAGVLLIDADKVPTGAEWRLRKNGDFIEKFGGAGTVKVKKFLSDKKVPLRVREVLPMLALDSEVFVIVNTEISEKLRVTEQTKNVYSIEFTFKSWV